MGDGGWDRCWGHSWVGISLGSGVGGRVCWGGQPDVGTPGLCRNLGAYGLGWERTTPFWANSGCGTRRRYRLGGRRDDDGERVWPQEPRCPLT